MAIFGYAKKTVNQYGLMELREVSFDFPAEDLRAIASFLTTCADQVDSGAWQTSHQHLSQQNSRWASQHPALDVIVTHPSPPPPKIVD